MGIDEENATKLHCAVQYFVDGVAEFTYNLILHNQKTEKAAIEVSYTRIMRQQTHFLPPSVSLHVINLPNI